MLRDLSVINARRESLEVNARHPACVTVAPVTGTALPVVTELALAKLARTQPGQDVSRVVEVSFLGVRPAMTVMIVSMVNALVMGGHLTLR